jgi:hypothetical protein
MHNTLTVDSNNPCSLGPFEFQPCPYAKIIKYGKMENCFFVKASHDGYRSLRHNRIVAQTKGGYLISDSVECDDFHCYESYIHLHPEVKVKIIDDFNLTLSKNSINIYISSLERIRIIESEYSPKYGTLVSSKSLKIKKSCNTYRNLLKISSIDTICEEDQALMNMILSN